MIKLLNITTYATESELVMFNSFLNHYFQTADERKFHFPVIIRASLSNPSPN